MEKEFIPYELALAIKELRFDEPCIKGFYNKEPIYTVVTTPVDFNNKKQLAELLSAPTFSQCFRWFREKYGLFISIFHYENGYSINDLRRFETYEEAELERLKKLIEIIKNK